MTKETPFTPERIYDDGRKRFSGGGRLGKALLVLMGLVFGFIILEAAASVAERAQAHKAGYSPVRGHRSREPLNAAGYRDLDHAKKKPPGVHRLVVVGDSFTYGAGVLLDDTYGKRLERALSTSRSEPWESIILATPGIGTEEEEQIVQNEALAYSPDVLVLGYVLNDAEGHDDAERRRALDWSQAEEEKRRPPLWRRSALFRLVADRLHATRENRLRVENHLALYRDGAPGFTAARQAIGRVAARCRDERVPLVAAIFPLFANSLDTAYPFESVHQKVGAVFKSSGAVVVDLLPYYRDLDWRLLVVEGARDEHPNELAHRIAAQALLQGLQQTLPPRTNPSRRLKDRPEGRHVT